MNISDKAFGYISFGAIVCVLTGVSIGMWHAHRETSSQAYVDFDELGALSPEDPVTENGYEIGRVGNVEWLGDRSRVTVIFDEPLTLREGTRFRNAAFALMGGRRIELERPRNGDILPKEHVFQGEFVPGITESLRFISEIRDQALNMRGIVEAVLAGTDSTPGVIERFRETTAALESLLGNLETASVLGEKKIRDVLGQAETASAAIGKTANTADSVFQSIRIGAETSIGAANAGLRELAAGIAEVDTLIRSIENGDIGKNLLDSKETLEKIQTTVEKMNRLAKAIDPREIAVHDESGNKVKLVRWKNLNIIGKTAREKAKDRQKKQ